MDIIEMANKEHIPERDQLLVTDFTRIMEHTDAEWGKAAPIMLAFRVGYAIGKRAEKRDNIILCKRRKARR